MGDDEDDEVDVRIRRRRQPVEELDQAPRIVTGICTPSGDKVSGCAGKFDMYVEDECAAYVRYCFKDPMDAAIFRSRFEPKSEAFRLTG